LIGCWWEGVIVNTKITEGEIYTFNLFPRKAAITSECGYLLNVPTKMCRMKALVLTN
jgi:hypothetical protein